MSTTATLQARILAKRQDVDDHMAELRRLVRITYPIGCRVAVTLGRSRVIGPVVGHGRYGDSADVYLENESTGKRRKFPADSRHIIGCSGYDVIVLTPPKELNRLRAAEQKRKEA